MIMKDVANCPRCGTIFLKNLRPICNHCYLEQEKNYEKVSSYMRRKQNRRATIREVHEETGVDLQQIHQFVREGRLLVSMFPNLAYPCESCGKDIQEGRLCSSCKENITEGLQKIEDEKNFTERVRQSQKAEERRTITYHSLNDRLK